MKFLPVEWQAVLWWRIMCRRYRGTSHFRIEAIKALGRSANLTRESAARYIEQVAPLPGRTAQP